MLNLKTAGLREGEQRTTRKTIIALCRRGGRAQVNLDLLGSLGSFGSFGSFEKRQFNDYEHRLLVGILRTYLNIVSEKFGAQWKGALDC
jgi:hypothetical protein